MTQDREVESMCHSEKREIPLRLIVERHFSKSAGTKFQVYEWNIQRTVKALSFVGLLNLSWKVATNCE